MGMRFHLVNKLNRNYGLGYDVGLTLNDAGNK